ncbi:MAG: septation protein A [Neisseria sp.]|nr:septation protein A [Neisseria sp.]
MKILSDLLAVILFFVTYTVTKNIIWATAVALVIGVLQAAFAYWKNGRLEAMQWISLILIVVFGGATIVFGNPQFIMWKPTLLFWAGAAAIVISQMLGKQPLQALMGKELSLPNAVWKKLAQMWAAFLVFMGAANLAVAYTVSEEMWVNYKLFGSTALMVLFMIAQGVYLSRHLKEEQ